MFIVLINLIIIDQEGCTATSDTMWAATFEFTVDQCGTQKVVAIYKPLVYI